MKLRAVPSRTRLLAAATALLLHGVIAVHAEEVKESHTIFGRLLEIRVEAADRETGQNRIRDAVTVARRLENILSTEIETSDISRLNAGAGYGPFTVPLDLYRLLALSQLMTRSTGDAFDVTVGPLLKRRQAAGGTRIHMDEALSLVGAEKIVLRAPDEAGLADAGMSVDFTAIRRGYCLERMAATLRAAGVEQALLEFGDSLVLAVGPPPGEAPFRVRISRGKTTAGTLQLRDRAVSTTRVRHRGDDGNRAPVVDPRSGRFLEADRQATVIARNAAIAEAWSTALVVDPDGALGLLEEPRDVEALVFDEHGEHATPRFASFGNWKPARGASPEQEGVSDPEGDSPDQGGVSPGGEGEPKKADVEPEALNKGASPETVQPQAAPPDTQARDAQQAAEENDGGRVASGERKTAPGAAGDAREHTEEQPR